MTHGEAGYLSRHCFQRQDPIGKAGADDHARHAPDCARLPVLHEYSSSSGMHGSTSIETVGAHSSEDHGQNSSAVDLGG